MEERDLGNIEPNMDVCDVNGSKIGTVVRVHRSDRATSSTGGPSSRSPQGEEVVEVKTGFLGLGKHLFVPVSAVHDVTAESVFLSKSRNEVDEADWQNKPSYLEEQDEVRPPADEPAQEILQPEGLHAEAPPAASTARWEDVLPHYRLRWEQRYGVQGARWETYEPRYRYAWEMANDPTYSGRSWYSVQPDLRRGWEARHPDTPWEQAADAIRDAWERATEASGDRTPR